MAQSNRSDRTPIKCSVENCQYNKSKMCKADNIEVNAMGDNVAETCDGTCCSTFKNEKQ